MLSRLDMMQQASSPTDLQLLREASCVRGADIKHSLLQAWMLHKNGCSPTLFDTLWISCCCDKLTFYRPGSGMLLSELPQKCCETFPASTIYQHQQAPWLQFQRGCHMHAAMCCAVLQV